MDYQTNAELERTNLAIGLHPPQLTQLDMETPSDNQQAVLDHDGTQIGAASDGESGPPLPDSVLLEPLPKKQKLGPIDAFATPTSFRVKWVATTSDLIPFCMNMDTKIIHAGKCQMQVVTSSGIAIVKCLKGCILDCPGHCACLCHILQLHYNTRWVEQVGRWKKQRSWKKLNQIADALGKEG